MMRRRYLAFGLIGLVATGAAVATAAQWTKRAAPDVEIIQSAYDAAEASAAAGRHADDLVIENADCNPLGGHAFMCQVSFTRRLEGNGRLYFDVITMTEADRRWQLTAGLCRGQARI
jgi:hypothetical protein